MLWIPLGVIATGLSSAATAVIAVRLRVNWDLRVSSVRWLLFMVFCYLFLWAIFRCALYVRLCVVLRNSGSVNTTNGQAPLTMNKLDCLGIHALPHLRERRNMWIALTASLGDTGFLGVVIWLLPLTYELSKLALQSVDCGPRREHAKLRVYTLIGHVIIAASLLAEIILTVRSGGYATQTHSILFANYILGIVTVAYIIGSIILIKCRGRHLESIHGAFAPSPVYLRLRQIMIAYTVMVLPFQISSAIIFTNHSTNLPLLDFIGASFVFSNCTGLVAAIVAGCSQLCVLRLCQCCLPKNYELDVLERHTGTTRESVNTTDSCRLHQAPVFVNTDIESSSSLWARTDSDTVLESIELHDSILRSALVRHDGYELTTRGDSFHLAFRTIKDAVAYCLDVQLELLAAPWPRRLHGLVPATETQRVAHRVVFRGLRVRMGVHDTDASEGQLVADVHTITGRLTFTGASEMIAEDVGDLGNGGQIVVTQRVADWLEKNSSHVKPNFVMSYLGELRPLTHDREVESTMAVFEVLPRYVVGRRKLWTSDRPGSPLSLSGNRFRCHPFPESERQIEPNGDDIRVGWVELHEVVSLTH